MRVRRMVRGLMVVVSLSLLAILLPVGVGAADPARSPDPRYIITRLGDQPPAAPVAAPMTTPTTPTTPMTTAPTLPQSFRFTAQGRITVTSTPGDLMLTIKGEFAKPDRLHATLTLSDSSSSDTIPPIELLVVGQSAYVHLTGDASPTGKDVWVLIDNPAGLTSVPGASIPNLANLPPVSAQTQTLGDETINGAPTTHTRTTVDATTLFGGAAKGAKPSMLTVDVWVGKGDNFPRRVSVNGNLSIDPSALTSGQTGRTTAAVPSSSVDATLSFTVDFSDFNAAVTINPPATFVKLSDLPK